MSEATSPAFDVFQSDVEIGAAPFGGLLHDVVHRRLESRGCPMRRHVPEPLHAGGLVGRVGPAGADVHLARHGLVDNGLLLLLQQRDQLLLGADVAPNAPFGRV